MKRAVLLVLANLAVVACGKKSGPVDPPFESRQDCTDDKSCTDKQNPWCMKSSADAGTGKCYPYPLEGRPLEVDGVIHVASYEAMAEVGDAELARLHAAAQDEHASIAAFARTIAELMALGAPMSLVAETSAALADEIVHTSQTLDVIEALTGTRPVLGQLTAAVLPLARPIEDFFRDVLRGGAIGETLAASAAEARLDGDASMSAEMTSRPTPVRALDERILIEESRHAALAFSTLRWLLEKKPSLRAILLEETVMLDAELRSLFDSAFGHVSSGVS